MPINCNPNTFIKQLSGREGWWIDHLKPVNSTGCSGIVGTITSGGTPFTTSCNDKISGIKYTKGKETVGSVQLVCNDGTVKQKYGKALDEGQGPITTFMCPSGSYLSNINGGLYQGKWLSSKNLKFGCKTEGFKDVKSNSNQEEEESNIGLIIFFIIFIILLTVFTVFIVKDVAERLTKRIKTNLALMK